MELDIEKDEVVDTDFSKIIEGVTSQNIVQKIKMTNPVYTFKFASRIRLSQANMARFMMEGLGFPARYWLCTGVKSLNILMKHNIKDTSYTELTEKSGRNDVLSMLGLPLFYDDQTDLGDGIFLVSDITDKNKRVRISCFTNDLPHDEEEDYVPAYKKKVAGKRRTRRKTGKVKTSAGFDYDEEDIPIDDIPF